MGKKNLKERCNLMLLNLLRKLSDGERSYLIKTLLNDKAVDLVSSVVFNALNCDFKIPSKTRKRVRKKLGTQSTNLIYASDKSNPVQKRRKKLSQSG